MILVIRIDGMVNVPRKIDETLHRMRLRRKYAAILVEDTPEERKRLLKIRNHVAYGTIGKEFLEKLLLTRGKSIDGKEIDAKKVASEAEHKKLDKLGVKPFFRLHPPRGGIESKKHYGVGKGVLGDHKDKIHLLVERML